MQIMACHAVLIAVLATDSLSSFTCQPTDSALQKVNPQVCGKRYNSYLCPVLFVLLHLTALFSACNATFSAWRCATAQS